MREREHVLQLENITMQFGGVVAVNNLSLEVNKGEIVALVHLQGEVISRHHAAKLHGDIF